MNKNPDTEGIQAIRDVRAQISKEFGNNPARLVEHYRLEQERYKERMLKTERLGVKASDT